MGNHKAVQSSLLEPDGAELMSGVLTHLTPGEPGAGG